jgi:hypothetical protein
MLKALVFVASLAAVHTAGPPPPSLVLGRVVDATSNRPIAGAIVTLFGSAAAGGSSPAPPHLMTNADGQFVARGLRKGVLFLVVTKGGYLDATNAQQRPGGSAQPIQVGDGQRITDVQVRMWRHAVITGTVVDETGEPIVGTRVQSFAREFIGGTARYVPRSSGTTDDRGVYRLPNLSPGRYKVAVSSTQVSVPSGLIDALLQGSDEARRLGLTHDMETVGAAIAPAGTPFALRSDAQTISFMPGTATPVPRGDGSFLIYPTMFYPSVQTAAQAAPVAVKAGEERVVDLQMQPFRAVKLSGTILAPEGFASNVPIRLVAEGNEDLLPDLETAATVSDTAGGFTFPAVPPGRYLLRIVRIPRLPAAPPDSNAVTVLRSGMVSVSASTAPDPGRSVPPPIPSDATLYTDVPVTVGDSDLTNLTVALQVGARVSGRVEFDGSGDPPDALAIANIRVTLEPADGSKLPDNLGLVTGRVDQNGRFTTYGVPPGRYLVRVSGLSDWFFKAAYYDGRDVADSPIQLGTEDISGVVVTFTDKASVVTGMVRTNNVADGEAVVVAFPVDSSVWTTQGSVPRRLRSTRAAANGSYTLPVLPPGDYYLAALKETFEGDWRDPVFLEVVARSAEQVRLDEGERKTTDLRTISVRGGPQ